jgi:hypothetical protein
MIRIEEVTSTGDSLDPEVIPVFMTVSASATSYTIGSSAHVIARYVSEPLKAGTHYKLKMAAFDSLNTIIGVNSNRSVFTTAP